MPLYFVDDEIARDFHPFALTRPACAMRAGALLLHERWAMLGERTIDGFIGAEHLTEFSSPEGVPPYVAPDATLSAGSVVINARGIPTLRAPVTSPLASGHQWSVNGRLAALRLRENMSAADAVALLSQSQIKDAREIVGRWMDHPWDYVRELPTQLADDFPVLLEQRGATAAQHITRVDTSTHSVYVEDGATIEPYAVFDLRQGPVLVAAHATVHAFTRVVGPTYIGPHSTVAGDRISMCAIGPHCRVHGEISQTVVAGYSNKSHDGFVGHSYVGHWVNLGAGTITSNLKNTYGLVHMWTPSGTVDTGMTFLGSLIGDYARTAIGSRLTTGCIIGAGANMVADGMGPKAVPPFLWHTSQTERHKLFQIEKFLEVAERQMARRGIPLDAGMRAYLTRVHALATSGVSARRVAPEIQ